MGKINKPHGNYCRICEQYKANEKFSGRGHATHICKACAKRGNNPPEINIEIPTFIDTDDIEVIYGDIDSFILDVETELPKPKKKRKPNKDKLLRAAQKKQAKEFLSKMLCDGDISGKTITEAAIKAGIPIKALRRAKGSLGIRSIVTETGTVWQLPK